MRLRVLYLKGLSHERGLAFEDMCGYWLVLDLNRGRGHFLNVLAAQMIF
jgi:hypothetical protein